MLIGKIKYRKDFYILNFYLQKIETMRAMVEIEPYEESQVQVYTRILLGHQNT
jgi:hypothetical protein